MVYNCPQGVLCFPNTSACLKYPSYFVFFPFSFIFNFINSSILPMSSLPHVSPIAFIGLFIHMLFSIGFFSVTFLGVLVYYLRQAYKIQNDKNYVLQFYFLLRTQYFLYTMYSRKFIHSSSLNILLVTITFLGRA